MSMRPRSSTWEWGAFADAMPYAKGSYDSWAAKRLFAAIRASFGRWLQRDRVAHVSTVTAARSVPDHGAGDQIAPLRTTHLRPKSNLEAVGIWRSHERDRCRAMPPSSFDSHWPQASSPLCLIASASGEHRGERMSPGAISNGLLRTQASSIPGYRRS